MKRDTSKPAQNSTQSRSPEPTLQSAPVPVETVYFAEGDLLFEENEKSFHFFVIQEGEVEIFKEVSNGDGSSAVREVVLARVGPGSSVGEFAMLDRKPRSASARAVTAITAARISPDAYRELLEELPEWAVAVMKALVERLRVTNEIVRNAQKSNNGFLGKEDSQALEVAEFLTDTQLSRIRAAEASVEQSDAEFDFSIYDPSTAPAPKNSAKK